MEREPIMAQSQKTENKIVIIGAPKCGQNSLLKYYKSIGKDVTRIEEIFKEDGVARYEKEFADRKPVLILRDNIDRIWSNYNFFGYKDSMTLKEYLKYDKPHNVIGEGNPVKQGRYQYWINKWKDHDLEIVYLEDLQKLEGFPHENSTKLNTPMTDKDRVMIKEAITQ